MPKITQRLRDLFGHTTIHVSITPEENPYVEGMSARQLYATQVNLHTVVSFLADSIAQLPLKVYRIRGEADRQRDRESSAAKLLYRPNADQTAYEFWEAVVKADGCFYCVASPGFRQREQLSAASDSK